MDDPSDLRLDLLPIPGVIQTVIAAYVPGKGWLTSRRGLCVKYAPGAVRLDEFELAELEAKAALRSMAGTLRREGVDLAGEPI